MSSAGNRASAAGVTLLEMMIVVTIIAIMAAISFPALTSGLAGVRLASEAGSTASFLTSAMNDVERHEQPAAIVITPKQNEIAVFTAASGDKPANKLDMPPGIAIEGEDQRRVLLYPGGAFPRISIVLRSEKGGRRSIEVDPVTAVPKITRLASDSR